MEDIETSVLRQHKQHKQHKQFIRLELDKRREDAFALLDIIVDNVTKRESQYITMADFLKLAGGRINDVSEVVHDLCNSNIDALGKVTEIDLSIGREKSYFYTKDSLTEVLRAD